MNGVSVTIIAGNEAKNIKACIQSVRWADEIIVVDSFSGDDTAAIAASLGAQVYVEPWKGFAAQKNSALDKARRPWILSLDADERITPELREEIERVVADESAGDGYRIARKNYFCGRWIRRSGWYPDYSIRLFRNGAGRFEERTVHEKVIVAGTVGTLRNPMEHYTYTSVSDYLRRLDRYSELAAKEMRRNGRKATPTTLVLNPLFTFFKMYILKRGFMDGSAGFFLAVSYAYYTFIKYYRLLAETGESETP